MTRLNLNQTFYTHHDVSPVHVPPVTATIRSGERALPKYQTRQSVSYHPLSISNGVLFAPPKEPMLGEEDIRFQFRPSNHED